MDAIADIRNITKQTIDKRISLVTEFVSNIIPISVKKHTQNGIADIPKYV